MSCSASNLAGVIRSFSGARKATVPAPKVTFFVRKATVLAAG
jgi:hypothetical protein